MVIELTDQEAQSVVEMVDLALKNNQGGGVRYAVAAAVVTQKIMGANQQNGQAPPPDEPKED